MRLCLVIESGTDVRLVEGLAERFDLSIVARRIRGGVEVSRAPCLPVSTLLGPASRQGFARFVWKHLRHHRADIDAVIVQGYGPAALAANLAGRLSGAHVLMLVCSPVEAYYKCRKAVPDDGDKPFRRRELWGLGALARLNAIVGDRYIVLSRHLASVVGRHGAAAEKIEVIPVYGVDTKLFAPPSEPKREIKERLGLPTGGSLIFFSSRIAPEKDSQTLLRAMRQLLDKGFDLWLLHRSGGHRAFLREAEGFGVAPRVIATDAVHPHAELPEDYRASDLCVQASREEGLGFSPLEALACEVPVIASAVGGLRETVIDGGTGWTYPVGDASALAEALAEALGNPSEAARRAANGRRLVCQGYERDEVFARLEKLLRACKKAQPESDLAEAS